MNNNFLINQLYKMKKFKSLTLENLSKIIITIFINYFKDLINNLIV